RVRGGLATRTRSSSSFLPICAFEDYRVGNAGGERRRNLEIHSSAQSGPYHPKAHEPSPLLLEKKKSVGRKKELGPVPEWSYGGRLGAFTVAIRVGGCSGAVGNRLQDSPPLFLLRIAVRIEVVLIPEGIPLRKFRCVVAESSQPSFGSGPKALLRRYAAATSDQ